MNPVYLVIDLFCGAGGVTEGFEQTNGGAKVIACVNHDKYAIMSHAANHPDAKHFAEDITTLDLTELIAHVRKMQALYPFAKLILWASLECTNHSRAKGGLAKDADSRTLADHLLRYIDALNPDVIQIENVVEFQEWGAMRIKMKNGKPVVIKNKHKEEVFGYEPIPECKGQDFERWKGEVCAFGYQTEWKQINSADFGEHTSRNRLFGVFAKDRSDIIFPEPTHSKTQKNGLAKWVAVKSKIDFTDEGYSIFYRGSNPNIPKRQRKDLSENTLERVYAGCIKHIAGGEKNFLAKYHGGKPRLQSMDAPLTVIDTQNRHAFISIYHGTGDNTSSMDAPHPVVTAADIHAAVFIHRDFKQTSNSSIDAPSGSITTVPKLNVVKAVTEPSQSHLFSLQWGGQMQSIESPAPVLLASADKTPIYMLTLIKGKGVIPIYDTDSLIVVKLKEFMALYGITDILMRMLRVDELLRIQGFPDKYKLIGTQSDQKKFIGNSVVPGVVKAWILAMIANNSQLKKTA